MTRLERGCAVVSSITVLIIMVLICFDAVTRKFHVSVPGVYELVQYMMVLIIFGGLAYTESTGHNIRMDAVTSRLPKLTQRILDATGLTLCLVISIFIVISSVMGTVNSFSTNEVIGGLVNYPVWPGKIIVLIGMLALSFRFFLSLTKRNKAVTGAAEQGAAR